MFDFLKRKDAPSEGEGLGGGAGDRVGRVGPRGVEPPGTSRA